KPQAWLQRKCACASNGGSGDCPECRMKREGSLQRQGSQDLESVIAPPIVYGVLRSAGRPLDSNARASMEATFGDDLTSVRVHTDAQSHKAARSLSARAFTVGEDIVFANGQYAPGTMAGRTLIAHELTHVLQQRNQSPGHLQRDTDQNAGASD